LIGRKFGRDYNVRNLYPCHVAASNQSGMI
jgi:hypothetical protein